MILLTNLSMPRAALPCRSLPLMAAAVFLALGLAACSGEAPPPEDSTGTSKRQPKAGDRAKPSGGGSGGAEDAPGDAGGSGDGRTDPEDMPTAGRNPGGSAGTGAVNAGADGGMSEAGGNGGTAGTFAADGGAGDASDTVDASTDDSGIPMEDPSAEIFDAENVPRFDITLPEASLAALNAITGSDDPRQDDYVIATFRYGDEELANIGIRIKGEGSFRPLSRKAPFKIKFDEFIAGQSFRGLKRLTLNNMVEDPSFIAERLAYDVFRGAGLPAPRCNSARVYVNGEFYGVYANVESEDKPFLRRWFTDDGGNLYEEGQRDFVPGSELSFDLETNEAANDRTDLIGLIEALDGSSATTLLADLEPHLDVTHFLRFTAAEAAVNQWDMYAYTLFWPNNFRFYSDPTTGKFVFLPWGMDMSMKPYRETDRPHIPVFGLAKQFDQPDYPISAGLIFQRCLESFECRERYAATVAEIIETYESLDLEAKAAQYYEQIREYVLEDRRKEYSEQLFEEGYQSVLRTIRERPAAMRSELTAFDP